MNYDELIKQVVIIVVGLVFIYLISYLSGVFSVNKDSRYSPPLPPEINPADLPSPEEMLKSTDQNAPWTF